MAYVPGFDHDVFISYARLNNVSYNDNMPGWVTEFLLALEKFMRPRLKREENLNPSSLSVWMDIRNIEGNDFWDDAIQKAARKSAVMISVLSESYLGSKNCEKEMETFCLSNKIEIIVGEVKKSRIFKVLLDDLDSERHPEPVRRNNGYKFFRVDPVTKRVLPVWSLTESGRPNPSYVNEIQILAADIAEVLNEMLKKPEKHAGAETRKVAYLAEVPDDLADERDAIRNTLLQKNVVVLPTYGLSNNSQNIERDVEECLERAEFYIHLLGPSYKRVSMDDSSSFTKLQHEKSTEAGQRKSAGDRREKLQRIVWIKPGFEFSSVTNPQHREFLESLVSEDAADAPLEVIREPSLEILKDIIEKKILGVKKPPPPPEKSALIYISHLPEDEDVAKQIEGVFAEHNHTIFRSLKSADRRERLNDNRSRLKGCDAVVVLYGNDRGVREVRERLEDAVNISNRRRRNPIVAKSLCDGPPTPKEDLGVTPSRNEWIHIECREEFDPECFSEFLEKLSKT